MNHMTLKPRISEKAYAQSEQANVYIFDVPVSANKHDIAKAVAAQYEVKVEGVRIAGVPGKSQKTYRDRGRKSIQGQRSNIRKAYVTLSENDKLPIFAALETPDAPKETK
jgi:ribosomal protein L23